MLIDQHAADERVRVECFLEELCLGFLHNQNKIKHSSGGVQVRELSPPFPVLLTLHEAQQLKRSRFQAAFRAWGFHFVDLSDGRFCDSDADSGSNAVYTQVSVQGIPDVVGDKVCLQSGHIRVRLITGHLCQLLLGEELQDLVKGFLGRLETEYPVSLSSKLSEVYEAEFVWLKALRWCPRELLELINSKACRGVCLFFCLSQMFKPTERSYHVQ